MRSENASGEFPWWSRVGRALKLLAALPAVACVGTPVQMYPGPELPRNEAALLEEVWRAEVVTIDGVDVSGSAWMIAPGSHEIWVKVKTTIYGRVATVRAWRYCLIKFEASPGDSYRTAIDAYEESAGAEGVRATMDAHIVDASGGVYANSERCQ